GLAAAGQPEYVLFTDADISYAPGTLTALVRAADGGSYGLVSQMALLRTETAWERLIVPAFVYFFAQLYPFRRVNTATALTAAAAGLAGWVLMTVSYVPMQRLYRLPAWRALALPVAAVLYGAMTFDSARRHWSGRGGEWKGRVI